MGFRHAIALALAGVSAVPAAAAEPYPFAGVFSVLRADFEKHYEMTKFLCLASISVQRADGTYTAYHIDTSKLGEPKVEFHPYETGSCEYAAEKRTEHCKVLKSNWGTSEYFIEHRGETDGALVQAVVSMRNPRTVSISNMRRCPFDDAKIKPFLSEEWLNYSDDDIDWTLYRHFPFNPEQAKQVRKILGLPE
jgi:hypothetical protein